MFRPSVEVVNYLVATSRIAMAVCDMEALYHVNPAFVSLFRCADVDEALRLHPVTDLAAPAHRDRLRASLAAVLAAEQSWEGIVAPLVRRDGSAFHALIHASSFLQDGRPLAFVTLLDDTPGFAQRERLALLVRAVDTIHEAVIVADPELAVIYSNRAAAELMGASNEELRGRDVRTVISPQARAAELGLVEALLVEGRWSAELLMRRVNGEEFMAHLTLSIVQDDQGAEIARIGIFRDITAQKQREEERALRTRQLGLMLHEAHHRIKNNLQLASDLLVLQSRAATPEVRTSLAAAAERLRALSVVHQWISPDHDVQLVDMRQVLETVARGMRETLTRAGETIEFDMQIEDGRLGSREATALALIVTELLTNAIRHGDPTLIRVRFACGPEDGLLEVADNGPRDPLPDCLERKRGFGLELVRLMAEEQLRGSFTLERADDATLARVTFPCAPAEE